MEKLIYQRTRDRKHQPNGVVLAVKHRNGIRFGWSKANSKAGDKFDLKAGVELATERALNGCTVPIPNSIQNDYTDMVNRGCRYFFKGKSVKIIPA